MTEELFEKANKKLKELKENGEVISLTEDRMFKSIFSDDNFKSVLETIILNVTDLTYEEVHDKIQIKNPNLGEESVFLKDNTVDVRVDIGKNTITLEMNQFNDRENQFRNMVHYHESIVKSIPSSSKRKDIGKVIQISFDNKNPISDDLISVIMMMDIKNHQIDSSEVNFKKYKVNLPKVRKMMYNEDKETRFIRILLMIVETKKEKLRKLAKGDADLEKMVKKMENLSEDPRYIRLLTDEEIREFAHGVDLKEAKDEGIKETKIETAKKLLDNNVDVDIIIDSTGLTKEEIENLKRND